MNDRTSYVVRVFELSHLVLAWFWPKIVQFIMAKRGNTIDSNCV